MIVTRRYRFCFPVYEYFFPQSKDVILLPQNTLFRLFGVISVIQSPEPLDVTNSAWTYSTFHTAYTDLTQPIDELFASFSPTKRNEINKIKKSTETTVSYHVLEPTQENISNFIRFFNEFARGKKLPTIRESDMQILDKALCITMIQSNGIPIVYHAYILDGTNRVRLYKSCSQYRTLAHNTDRSWVWYCNNYCHYRDIEHFQKAGVKWYDWGGLSLDADGAMHTIDAFKLAFRPMIRTEYNAILYGQAFRVLFATVSFVSSFFSNFFQKKWTNNTITSWLSSPHSHLDEVQKK